MMTDWTPRRMKRAEQVNVQPGGILFFATREPMIASHMERLTKIGFGIGAKRLIAGPAAKAQTFVTQYDLRVAQIQETIHGR